MPELVIRNGVVDGERRDILCRDGLVAMVEPPGSIVTTDAEVIDANGFVVVGAAAEPHAHLDKVLTADAVPNPGGDLFGAISAWRETYGDRNEREITHRAEQVIRRSIAAGITAIRTHVDCGPGIELRAIEALIALRERWAPLIDIEICALVAPQTLGEGQGAAYARLRDAITLGVDLVGGVPYAEASPRAATAGLLEQAAGAGLGVDFHTDETLDPTVLSLVDLAELAIDFPFPVAASHCCSLAMQDPARQADVAAMVADAGVHVVALPQTNLFLQARGHAQAPVRGITAIGALRAAGATVSAGADNVQDPFNTMGRVDPCEIASLLVTAGHVDAGDSWSLVAGAARATLGLGPAGPVVGAMADLVALRGDTLRGAVADGAAERIVIRRGAVVSRTSVDIASNHPLLA
ncbi:MAG: amidohydrolase family protein [Actinomycetota bacterium]